MTKVLLVDDHKLVRQAVKRALIDHDFEVIGEAGDGEEGVRLANELSPDVIMLDITMPVMDGLTALKMIKSQNPDTKVVMLTMHGESSVVNQAISSGADAFMTKDAPMAVVIDVVKKIAGGEIISQEIAQNILNDSKDLVISDPETGDESLLTKREVEILQAIADGKSTNDVAEGLFISVKTVKNHLASIYEKLDARDRTQAVLTGIKTGIISIR